jgi:hypothetical protein
MKAQLQTFLYLLMHVEGEMKITEAVETQILAFPILFIRLDHHTIGDDFVTYIFESLH